MDKKIDQNWIESFRLAHKNFQEAYLFSYNQFIYFNLYIYISIIYFHVINVNFIDSLILLIYMIFTNIFLISFMKF